MNNEEVQEIFEGKEDCNEDKNKLNISVKYNNKRTSLQQS